MQYLKNLTKYVYLLMVLGLIGMSYGFGGQAHISGSTRHSQSTNTHISGTAYLNGNVATIKTHVSGLKKKLPILKSEPAESNIIRKARSIGITLGTSMELNSTQVNKKTTTKK